MSGKRQHFIPRFLQMAFQSHASGEGTYAWVYRKDVPPHNTNIINIGVEGFFYSHEGDNQVDDAITSIEGQLSALIDILRNTPGGQVGNASAIAPLLAHLEIRTRHLRESFSSTARIITESMLRLVDNPRIFGVYLKRKIENDPLFMQDILTEELTKRGLPITLLPIALQASKLLINQMLPSILTDIPLLTNHLREALPKMLKNASKEGHIKSLNQSLSPQLRIEQYNNFEFRVLETPTANLPIGDSILIFQVQGERQFKPISDKGDIIQNVFLPLSPRTVLVGSKESNSVNLNLLPMVIAQCSLEFFISSFRHTIYDECQSHIGEFAYMLSEDQIIDLLTDIFLE